MIPARYCLSIECRPTTTECIYLRSYDLDLDPMTLILDLDLETMKMYLHIKNEVLLSRLSNNRAQPGHTYWIFCSCDLDLDPMTLTYKSDLDIQKVYLHSKNKVSGSRLSKVTAQTGQKDRQTQTDVTARITTPHSGVITTPLLYRHT